MSAFASAALRVIPGLFIANSGLGKIGMPAEASEGVHQAAVSGIPALESLPADKFGSYLGYAETALGGALLAPFVPNWLAGAGLTAFGGGLLTMYFNNEENTQEDGIRPTNEGLSLAKDSWLVAIGLGLMASSFAGRRKDGQLKSARKKAKKAVEKLKNNA